MSKLPPQQIEANQRRLLAAAQKGEQAFNEEWAKLFPPNSNQSPNPSKPSQESPTNEEPPTSNS